MSSHTVTQLVHDWGVVAVFAAAGLQALGAPLPGTTVLIAAALYAGSGAGRLSIVVVILAGALGALAGTSLAYAVGRWRGAQLLHWAGRRLRQSPARVQALRLALERRGSVLLVVGRFVTGARNVCGLLAGAGGMDVRRFVGVSALAALAWAAINGLEYYWFGRALTAADTWLQVLLVAIGVLWLIVSLRWMRSRAIALMLEAGEEG